MRNSDFVLFMRCLGAFILRGNAKRMVASPRSIVIVQFAKLGDMVCTTPVFRAVKKASPGTRVIVVGNAVNRELLAGNSDIDRYVVCGTDISPALRELKEERIEAGINVGPSLRGFALLYLAGIPTVVTPRIEGGVSSETRLYRFVRTFGILSPIRIGSYIPREYLRLLEPLGISADDTAKHLSYTSAGAKKVSDFFRDENIPEGSLIIGIAASAGNKLKNWPPERFAAVADHISSRYGATILIVGAETDREESQLVYRALGKETRAMDVSGRFTMDEFKALIARLSLFISVDTGPIYIAEAFGVPTIDIVGPMDEHEQPPVGPRNLVVVPPFARKPVLFIMSSGNYDVREARRQAESITAEHVISAADSLLSHVTDSAGRV